ncbi:MAG: hypothetical protein M3297_01270, partial [Thermoproteota archaeon]|nr:hypothetical protein [Thermoproteota archaeon]
LFRKTIIPTIPASNITTLYRAALIMKQSSDVSIPVSVLSSLSETLSSIKLYFPFLLHLCWS